MAIRLIECKKVLKDTGSIYLHCDPTMSHYLKLIMDCIFGENNFRNELIWCYKGASEMKFAFPKKHDIILFYAKTTLTKLNYDEIRVPYKDNNKKIAKWADGIHKKHPFGTKCLDWFSDIPSFMTASQSKERVGYPTQKPLALLNRIIKASSNEGDVILDPFCGCATTCISAEILNRNWIGIDISYKAFELVKERLKKEVKQDLLDWDKKIIFRTDTPKPSNIKEEETGGFVYIISNPKFYGSYKIGITSDPEKRLNSYQTSDPERVYKIEYKKQTEHFQDIEKEIIKTYPSKNEWIKGDLNEIINDIKNYNPLKLNQISD